MPIRHKSDYKPANKTEIVEPVPAKLGLPPAIPSETLPETQPDDTDCQMNFDTKSSEAIDTFGQALASSGLNAAFCVIFDEADNYKPKVFYRGDMFEITRHTSRILNQMRFKLIGELNGNF
jgi:hypothetical protein